MATKEVNTIMEPFVWNYTQYKGTSFSRLLVIDADLTGAVYEFEITGAKGTVKPLIRLIQIQNKQTILNVSLTAQQIAVMAPQNKWFFRINFKGESFLGWIGQFNLRSFI